ncbi:MAG: DMT family transporter [Syntrophomonadaceae bacterium]
MHPTSKELKGSLYILFSALMYATLPVLVKLAYRQGLTPESTLFLRYLFSFLFLAIVLVGVRREPVLTLTPLVFAQGILLTAGGLFYFFALEYLAAGLTTVIFFAHPALVALLSIIIYSESLAPRVMVGLTLALTGVFFLSGLQNGSSPAAADGIIYALLACLCYALYSLAGQKTVADGKPLSITATIALIAIFIIAPIYPQDAGAIFHLTWPQLLVTVLMACFNTLLAVLFFLKGLQQIGATRATLISTAEPVFCLILAYLILGETLTMKEIIGAGMVLASMFLAIRPAVKTPAEPEAVSLEHL